MSTDIGSQEGASNTDPGEPQQNGTGPCMPNQHDRSGWPFVERRRRMVDRRQNTGALSITERSAPLPQGRRSSDSLSAEASQLTAREQQIVHLLLQGMSNKRIAQQLGIVEDTVKKHLQHIYDKCGVRSRTLMMLGQAAWNLGHIDSPERRNLTG